MEIYAAGCDDWIIFIMFDKKRKILLFQADGLLKT